MNLSDVLRDRFADEYERARTLSRTGQIISRVSLALTLGPLLFGVSEAGDGRMGPIFLLWGLSGLMVLLGYGLGKLVMVQSEVLTSSIDLAVNSCSTFSDVVRADLLAASRDSKSRVLSLSLEQPSAVSQTLQPDTFHHSPIAALIAAPVPSYSHFTPLPRLRSQIARADRRRFH